MEFFCGPSSSSSSSSSHRRNRASTGGTATSSRDESRQWSRSSLPSSQQRGREPEKRSNDTQRGSSTIRTASSQPQTAPRRSNPGSTSSAGQHRVEYAPGAGSSSSASSTTSTASSRSTNATSASSSTHPSPTTSNSLRTPPDVGPRGSYSDKTVIAKVGGSKDHANRKSPLTMAEIDQRLELLDTLATEIDVSIPSLPRRVGSAGAAPSSASSKATASSATMSRDQSKASGSSKGSRDADSKRNGVVASSSSIKKRASPAAAGDDEEEEEEEEGSISVKKEQDREPPRKKTRGRASTNSRDYTPSPEPEHAAAPIKREPENLTKAPVAATTKSPPSPSPSVWSKSRFSSLSAHYQSKGRELKHCGDRRTREAGSSSSQPSSSASASQQRQIAIYEQTEAVLLYVYGFWCEDAAATLANASGAAEGSASPAVMVGNWRSLLGLIHYVGSYHERRGECALGALCRLVEGLVLRHMSGYEARQVGRHLAKLAASSGQPAGQTGSSAAQSPAPGDVAPSPAARSDTTNGVGSPPSGTAADVHASLADLAANLGRVQRDEDRAAKLVAQARGSSGGSGSSSIAQGVIGALSNASLARDFPQTWATCQRGALVRGDAWSSATAVDPAAVSRAHPRVKEDGEADGDDDAGVWAWPFIEASGPAPASEAGGVATGGACLPHVVCFGRALLRERAQRCGLRGFELAELGMPASK